MIELLEQQAPDGRLYWQWIASGLSWTVLLAIASWFIAFILGLLIGVLRTTTNKPIKAFATAYVELFRNIPVLVQMFLWYFVFPEIAPRSIGDTIKEIPPPWGSFWPAMICLSLYTASRVAEQVRTGLEALPSGQIEAAKALGLTPLKVYALVLVPQALRLIIPSLTSEVMAIFKNTSVALTIGLMELTAQARSIAEATFETFAAFGVVTVLYLGLALIIYGIMRKIDARYATFGHTGTALASKKKSNAFNKSGWV